MTAKLTGQFAGLASGTNQFNHLLTSDSFCKNNKVSVKWGQLQLHYANFDEAKHDITDYIVGFYNCTRLHSTLGYLSPAAFERKMAAKQPIAVSENT